MIFSWISQSITISYFKSYFLCGFELAGFKFVNISNDHPCQSAAIVMLCTGLAEVRKWSGKKLLQDQGKVREFYFESGKIETTQLS